MDRHFSDHVYISIYSIYIHIYMYIYIYLFIFLCIHTRTHIHMPRARDSLEVTFYQQQIDFKSHFISSSKLFAKTFAVSRLQLSGLRV